MKYHVELSDLVVKKMKKLDRPVAALIIGFIEKNLEGCENPRWIGKPLVGNHQGKWRYRMGDYRILAKIDDAVIKILIIDLGHRSDIY